MYYFVYNFLNLNLNLLELMNKNDYLEYKQHPYHYINELRII
jgi:hypothetical protein